MQRPQTFYWYDYETFGNNPTRDWPAQFAGIRTDADFNETEPPLELFCRLPADKLPQIDACLITGLTPQMTHENGLCEADFISKINQVFSDPGTCVTGYNSLNFDDEVTRFSLYRNFLDPYAREWQNGNSRWDLINTVRLYAALRPEHINWPVNEDGTVSFKLEQLTKINNIGHDEAHNAVSDVRATIELARLLRKTQPKMLDYVLTHKDKISAAHLLDLKGQKPVIHVSGRYSAKQACMAVVIPLALHPVNKNEIIVCDLSYDPAEWINCSEEEMSRRIFSKNEILEQEGMQRIPLKTVRINRCPVIVPFSACRPEDKKRLEINQSILEKHYVQLKDNSLLAEKLVNVFSERKFEKTSDSDPDQMLYSGGFFSSADKNIIDQVSQASPDDLGKKQWHFNDKRLPKMLFRYRARNWPETLSEEEALNWKKFCQTYFLQPNTADNSEVSRLECFINQIKCDLEETKYTKKDKEILNHLFEYGKNIKERLSD
ncbi:MAG: exodeoxyribonuclease I [Endozoicomonadaceae bacterium]|nr:exodeoxyribonuclease I [Endozoicomonadaceae bacterium]